MSGFRASIRVNALDHKSELALPGSDEDHRENEDDELVVFSAQAELTDAPFVVADSLG